MATDTFGHRAEELDPQFLIEYARSDDWWVEQKLDGRRVFMGIENGLLMNKKMQVVGKTDAKTITGLDYGLLDGELVDDHLWFFDIVHYEQPFCVRRQRLEDQVNAANLIPCYKTVEEKLAFCLEAMNQSLEGIILRRRGGLYAQKNTLLKVKFKKTADCVVFELGRKGKSAIGVSLLDGETWVDVGACSTHGKNFTLDIGDVVEVEYLYATESRRLYQTVLIRKRDDKYADECTIDQLQYTNKKVVV